MNEINSECENDGKKYKDKLLELKNLKKQHDDATAKDILETCHDDELPSVKGINNQMRTLASQILILILKHLSFEIPCIASQNLNSPIHLFLKEIVDPTTEPGHNSDESSAFSLHFIFELKTWNGEILDSILLESDQTPRIAAELFEIAKLIKVVCPMLIGVCEYLKSTEGPESHTIPYYRKPWNRNANGKVRINPIGCVELEYEGKVKYDGNTRNIPREQNSISCFPRKAFVFRKSVKKQPKNDVMKPPSRSFQRKRNSPFVP